MRSSAASSSSLSFLISTLNLWNTISFPKAINRIFKISLTSSLLLPLLLTTPPLLLFFFLAVSNPSTCLLFLLYLIPQALHSDWKIKSSKNKIRKIRSNYKYLFDFISEFKSTLGPAGPPLQRGVLVVWQSLQHLGEGVLLLFFFFSSESSFWDTKRVLVDEIWSQKWYGNAMLLTLYSSFRSIPYSTVLLVQKPRNWTSVCVCWWVFIQCITWSIKMGF